MIKRKKKKLNKLIFVSEKKKISLEERFKNYKGNNLTKDFSWDERVLARSYLIKIDYICLYRKLGTIPNFYIVI